MAVEPVIITDGPTPPEVLADADRAGFESASLHAFRRAAVALKAAEDALVAARQAYAEAVKALSEEAVR